MNIQIHKERTASLENIYRPVFFRLRQTEDKQRFNELLAREQLFVHDEIDGQLRELVKSRNPSRQLSEAECGKLVEQLTGNDPDEYGVWVYYPWSVRIVHLLDEKEFTELRTSRNKYKITADEQARLARKKVGVIGLSVGQSVAVTMAMERSFGEIRLADFDILELTNLNRIRTDLANLGLKKVISVAREIAGIDPFLEVKVFDEGLNDANIDEFFTGSGRLDVVIDECDGIDMKIKCRTKARELKVPVLMEASDRCTIDVERFDLDPGRPLLHGYIDHLDISKLDKLRTNEEKIPYLAPMVGIDTMSARLKASAMEVGHSITTWPQLASAVVMGGGALADIWRRIALGQFHDSGRYFIDTEELIGDKREDIKNAQPAPPSSPISFPDMHALANRYLNRWTQRKQQAIYPPEPLIRELVAAAAMAPSGGNSQPWKWVYKDGVLLLLLDSAEGYSYMNFRDSAAYIALGAAIENLVLKACQRQTGVRIDYFPLTENPELIAAFSFEAFRPDDNELEAVPDKALVNYIEKRHTNRKFPQRVELPAEALDNLKAAAESIPDVELTYVAEHQAIEAIGKIIGVTDRLRILDPESNYDFTQREMRWNEEEAFRTRTGMDVATLELRESELIGLRFIKNPEVISFISKINGGQLLKNASAKNAASASVFGLITVPSFSESNFLAGGRAGQRLWLSAEQAGIAFHPMNVPLAYFARLKHAADELPDGSREEIETLYRQFTGLFNYKPSREEVYLFRLFKADRPSKRAYRRELDDILTFA